MKITKIVSYQLKDLNQSLINSLEILGWEYDLFEKQINVNFDLNAYSWGSTLEIELVNEQTLKLVYKTNFPLQIYDWGDSNRKIRKLMTELKRFEVLERLD
ncbi:MAG: hypothetical protein Q4G27_02160 [Flavobacteriaceae bacterium]|nr:hypothetical protein [Flavobacteriaceae bacterium]